MLNENSRSASEVVMFVIGRSDHGIFLGSIHYFKEFISITNLYLISLFTTLLKASWIY